MYIYLFIYDDLLCMDNAFLRRNYFILYVKYDEIIVVLIGDVFNIYFFELFLNVLLESYIIVELVKILSVNGGIKGMILG